MLSTCEQPNWGFASGGVVNGSNRPHSGRPTVPTWTRSLPGTIIGVEPCAGTTMNVAQWLNAIGLGQYEANFRENKIDFDVLADLSDGDLQELGVPLGDRRRLLRAIAELGAQQPRTTQARRTPAVPAPFILLTSSWISTPAPLRASPARQSN